MAQPRQPLRPFVGANIPPELRSRARWAPWRAQWNEKRQKWDKIPCQANGYGLSTAKPERWLTYEAALSALRAKPDQFAGIGYCMTGPHGLVGTDIDGCVNDDGTVEPWAIEVVDALASYTEISPSGRGLRIFSLGEVPEDWTNHEVGIEVYAGHEPRFLTVTGEVMADRATIQQARAGVLADLSARYARQKTTATVISLQLPDLVDELALPDPAELDLPYHARDFLAEGTHRGDRSRELFATAVALFAAGLGDDEVLSVLAANPHAMEVALDHRRQDADRALMYLWAEHTQKAKGRATSKVATVDDFEDVSEPQAPGTATAAKNQGVVKKPRFKPLTLVELMERPRGLWTIKRVLPQSGVGMVYGPSMSGKSFFVVDVCMAVARGVEWRSRRVKQGAVAYIAAEGMGGFPDRVRAYRDYHGIDLAGLPLHVIPAAPNLLERDQVKELVGELKSIPGLRVVVVDTLAQTTAGGDENASKDIGTALAHCKAISEATGALVLLVGHTGKDEEKGPRGHSSQIAAFDVAIRLERDGDLREATIAKLKDGEGEGDAYPFHLSSVVLGQDEDGEDITSCVVLPGLAKGAQAAAPKLGPLQQMIYDKAATLLDLGGLLQKEALIAEVVASLPKPRGEDNRRRDVKRELPKLVKLGMLLEAAGVIALPASESAVNNE